MPEDTLLVYHTLHVPRHTSDPGMWEADGYLAQHVAQLNAAGRHVAQSLLYHVVDVEAMAAQMSQDTVLVDNTHPGPDFMMQARNQAQCQSFDIGQEYVAALNRIMAWVVSICRISAYAKTYLPDRIHARSLRR